MEGHPVFLRLWRRGYGASWGGQFATVAGPVFFAGFEFSALHLNFTPDGEVAQITLIYLEGSVGRFICKFELALVQKYFGKPSLGCPRWIRKRTQNGNSFFIPTQPFQNDGLAELVPKGRIKLL